MSARRLVAALACRANGSRLYGKPLQNLSGMTTILDQIVSALRTFDIIDEIVLGISQGTPVTSFA
jgi:spore coat polysaccharide biosynthesis protein SpsF